MQNFGVADNSRSQNLSDTRKHREGKVARTVQYSSTDGTSNQGSVLAVSSASQRVQEIERCVRYRQPDHAQSDSRARKFAREYGSDTGAQKTDDGLETIQVSNRSMTRCGPYGLTPDVKPYAAAITMMPAEDVAAVRHIVMTPESAPKMIYRFKLPYRSARKPGRMRPKRLAPFVMATR